MVSRGTLEDTTVEEWDRVMDINAKGVFLGTKSVIDPMRQNGGGSIVNISSISGLIGQGYLQPVYNSSKGAVRLLTKSTAIQYASDNIRANSVHPGTVATEMNAERRADVETFKQSLEKIPLGRVGYRWGLYCSINLRITTRVKGRPHMRSPFYSLLI